MVESFTQPLIVLPYGGLSNDIRIKQTFNDTIYTLSDSKIKPYLIFELGDWAWQYQDRLEEGGCEKKIMIDYALENERCIYFHFHTGFYTKNRQAFVDYIIKLIIELC